MAADPDIESVAGILIVDATVDDLPITWASPGFELVTGYGAIEVLGRNPRLLQGPDTDPRAVSALREAIGDGRDSYLTLLNYRADGTPFWNELSVSPQRDKRGTIVSWIAAIRDVTDRMRAAAKLHELAFYDQLTGLVNHSALYDEMRSALHRARVHDREAALLLIDIEDFAAINDAHGRDVGDAILRAAADRLQGLVRPNDTLARTDSDEFALLLPDLHERASEVASELAVRLQAALREPFGTDNLKIELRANVGIAVFPGALTSPELYAQAGIAVDHARGSGRDYHLFVPKPARLLVSADEAFGPEHYETELRTILEQGQIRCELEPIVSLANRAVVGYEAFARGPDGSALHTPRRLRSTAEAAGLLAELDWACRDAALRAAACAELPEGTTLFINATLATIGDEPPATLAEAAKSADARYDVILDLSIDDLERDAVEALRVADRWQARGGRIAIDDLGAGTRALGLLPLLDPDVVKLDVARIQGHAPSERARLAAAVAAYSERTGGQVLAEWIESDADVTVAQALGARFGSGRLFDNDAAAAASIPRRPTQPKSGPEETPFSLLSQAAEPLSLDASAVDAAMTLAEQRAQHCDGVVLLSVVPSSKTLDEERLGRLRSVARRSSLVAIFGDELGAEPVADGHGVQLAPGDPLNGSWCLIVLGTDVALALAAQRLDGDEPRFALARTTDPSLVVAAARSLLPRLTAPAARPAGEDRS
jgi:diguanylate cyclase (GGDEF)-like protein/PAS domain S-box-containing protein